MDTTQGTKTTTLALTVGDEDMTYSCKYTATDGFSVEDYVIHQVAGRSGLSLPGASSLKRALSLTGFVVKTIGGKRREEPRSPARLFEKVRETLASF